MLPASPPALSTAEVGPVWPMPDEFEIGAPSRSVDEFEVSWSRSEVVDVSREDTSVLNGIS